MAANQQMLLGAHAAAPSGLTVVQAAKGIQLSGTTVTVSISPTAGNMLVVGAMTYSFSASLVLSCSDNIGGGTGWVSVTQQTFNAGGGNTALFYKPNVPSGITTITLTQTNPTAQVEAIVHEVSGASPTTPFTTGEDNSGASTSGTNPQTGSATNATPASILFAFMTTDASVNPANLTINGTGTVGTWNLFDSTNSQELNAATNWPMSMPNQVVSSSAAQAHGWTITSGDAPTAQIIAAFHA